MILIVAVHRARSLEIGVARGLPLDTAGRSRGGGQGSREGANMGPCWGCGVRPRVERLAATFLGTHCGQFVVLINVGGLCASIRWFNAPLKRIELPKDTP